MPSLTDGEIRQALKRVERACKQETLTDGEGRGTGRLVLILKPMPTRVTAEWMAQQWRNGKRTKSKWLILDSGVVSWVERGGATP